MAQLSGFNNAAHNAGTVDTSKMNDVELMNYRKGMENGNYDTSVNNIPGI